jgi:DNA-directed RNA polymerase specialized sigma24 family protein
VTVDRAVVRQAQRGSEEAFGAIVNESIDRLFAISTLIARDRTLAEDAVQDALLRAWRDLRTLRDPDRLSAWLARLTVNATYDLLRRRRRIGELKPLHETIANGHDEAAATVDRANTLGIPAGTARSRLHGGLAAMRRSLGVNSAAGLAVHKEAAQ